MDNIQPMMDDPSQQMGMPPQGPQGMPPQGPDPAMMQQAMQEEADDAEDQLDAYLDHALSQKNIALEFVDKLDKNNKNILELLGEKVHDGYMKDEESREGWLRQTKEALKLALLVREEKTWPWPKAANVKYPLLATAAMQFSARAYPALVPSDKKVVKAKVVAKDPDGRLNQLAGEIASHMSHQLMEKVPNWEEDMDKLLVTMAITGICFKKTYHNPVLGVHHSHLVYPENFVVNYWAKNLEKAYRKTELLYYTKNEIYEKENNDKEFLPYEYSTPVADDPALKEKTSGTTPPPVDDSTPHVFLAQHTFHDLDGDGYEEPYIITIHRDTKKVVKIIARWDSDGVHRAEPTKKNKPGKIIRIEPVEYFTAFPFIPNPDGSIYAVGFGLLLGPINESVNTLINQLMDAGTLNNLQSGFIGKGLRIKMGVTRFDPGEWKVINATNEDISKAIYPLPTKEPSAVLMNLLQMLITSGNQLASIAEIFVGKMPGQNTPATTTQETVKQGMAVFTAVYKRIYRSLDAEFKKLFRLNRITTDLVNEEARDLGLNISQMDYDDDNRIIPGGDPTGDSESTKMQKVQSVGQMLQLQTINPMEFTKWNLELLEVPNWEKLIAQPQPPKPSPEEMKAQVEMKSKEQDMQIKAQLAQMKAQEQQQKLEFEQQMQAIKLQGEQMKAQMDQLMSVAKQRAESQKMQQEVTATAIKTNMDLRASQAQHQQKIAAGEAQLRQKQKAKTLQKSK